MGTVLFVFLQKKNTTLYNITNKMSCHMLHCLFYVYTIFVVFHCLAATLNFLISVFFLIDII